MILILGLGIYFVFQQEDKSSLQIETLGEQKTLVVLSDFTQEPQNFSNEDLDEMVFGDNSESVNRFYRESSYGKMWLSGEVLGPIDFSQYLDLLDRREEPEFVNTIIQEADSSVDFSEYEKGILIIFSLVPESRISSREFGTGYYGESVLHTDEGDISVPIIKMYITHAETAFLQRNIVIHELGHSLGLPHSGGYDCSGKATAMNQGDCLVTITIGYDIMSYGLGYDFNSFYKEKLGWLNEENIAEVKQSGIFTLTPLESGSEGLKTLKIPISKSPFEKEKPLRYYYLEYRQPSNKGSNDFDGVLVYTIVTDEYSEYVDAPMLVEINSGLSKEENIHMSNYVLHEGESYNDARNKVRIETLKVTSSDVQVKIDFT